MWCVALRCVGLGCVGLCWVGDWVAGCWLADASLPIEVTWVNFKVCYIYTLKFKFYCTYSFMFSIKRSTFPPFSCPLSFLSFQAKNVSLPFPNSLPPSFGPTLSASSATAQISLLLLNAALSSSLALNLSLILTLYYKAKHSFDTTCSSPLLSLSLLSLLYSQAKPLSLPFPPSLPLFLVLFIHYYGAKLSVSLSLPCGVGHLGAR